MARREGECRKRPGRGKKFKALVFCTQRTPAAGSRLLPISLCRNVGIGSPLSLGYDLFSLRCWRLIFRAPILPTTWGCGSESVMQGDARLLQDGENALSMFSAAISTSNDDSGKTRLSAAPFLLLSDFTGFLLLSSIGHLWKAWQTLRSRSSEVLFRGIYVPTTKELGLSFWSLMSKVNLVLLWVRKTAQ